MSNAPTRESTRRTTVVRIVEYLNRDTISALEDMLARARRGLCFAYKTDTDEPMGLTGVYTETKSLALCVASRLAIEVNKQIREDRYD